MKKLYDSEFCEKCGLQKINYKQDLDNGLSVKVTTFMGGLNWHYKNKKGDSLSIILHAGSYGREDGLFEVLPSWENDVTGHLTFGQVQEYINKLIIGALNDDRKM